MMSIFRDHFPISLDILNAMPDQYMYESMMMVEILEKTYTMDIMYGDMFDLTCPLLPTKLPGPLD